MCWYAVQKSYFHTWSQSLLALNELSYFHAARIIFFFSKRSGRLSQSILALNPNPEGNGNINCDHELTWPVQDIFSAFQVFWEASLIYLARTKFIQKLRKHPYYYTWNMVAFYFLIIFPMTRWIIFINCVKHRTYFLVLVKNTR